MGVFSRDTHTGRFLIHQLANLMQDMSRLSVETTLYRLFHFLRGPRSERPISLTANAESKRVARVRAYIDHHFHLDISMKQLTSIAGCSPKYLNDLFKAQLGTTPYAYLIARRIREARMLLLSGIPPSELAVRCGFYDQSHLNRHFVRVYGQPPRAYARALRMT